MAREDRAAEEARRRPPAGRRRAGEVAREDRALLAPLGGRPDGLGSRRPAGERSDGASVHPGNRRAATSAREPGAHDARVCARHEAVRWSSAASAAPRLAAAVDEAAAAVRARPRRRGSRPGRGLRLGAPRVGVPAPPVAGPRRPRRRPAPRLLGGRRHRRWPRDRGAARPVADRGRAPRRRARPRSIVERAGAAGAGARGDAPSFLLLADPFTFDVESCCAASTRRGRARPIGGLASGGRSPGDNALYLDDAVYRRGLVGVALTGDVAVDTIVAQGCRPIGEPMFVTRCERNVLQELDGRRAGSVLQELYDRATRRRPGSSSGTRCSSAS